MTSRSGSRVLAAVEAACLILVVGCSGTSGPFPVPVRGVVLLDGKPLSSGAVQFQPTSGQPASGEIAGDGSFTLSRYRADDGAVPGRHAVSVSCYEGHRPDRQGGDSMGKLLIPLKYTRLGSSGLTAEIKDTSDGQAQDVVLELSGPPATFK